MTKWWWIAHELEQLGFNWLAETADKIDEILCKLYPNEEETFTKDVRTILSYCVRKLAQHDVRASLDVVYFVANSSEFCVACRHASRIADETGKDMCEVCLFAGREGMCREDGLFNDFRQELEETMDWIDEQRCGIKAQA